MADRHGVPSRSVSGPNRFRYAPSTGPGASSSTASTSNGNNNHSSGHHTTMSASTAGGGGANSNNSHHSVRRNLFQSQLTRRPTAGRPTNNPAEADGGFGPGFLPASQQGGGDAGDADSSDIVVRDKNGEIELDDPPTPIVDDPDEIALDSRQENERERQRLADAVKSHQINQNSVPAQPEELLEAVRASLRAKVAALSEDNWMFEKEDDLRQV